MRFGVRPGQDTQRIHMLSQKIMDILADENSNDVVSALFTVMQFQVVQFLKEYPEKKDAILAGYNAVFDAFIRNVEDEIK